MVVNEQTLFRVFFCLSVFYFLFIYFTRQFNTYACSNNLSLHAVYFYAGSKGECLDCGSSLSWRKLEFSQLFSEQFMTFSKTCWLRMFSSRKLAVDLRIDNWICPIDMSTYLFHFVVYMPELASQYWTCIISLNTMDGEITVCPPAPTPSSISTQMTDLTLRLCILLFWQQTYH